MKIKKTITMSEVGLDSRVNLEQLFCIMQDAITVLFEKIKLSNYYMRTIHHGIWVFSKNKVNVNKRPYFNEEVIIESNIVEVDQLRVYVKTKCLSKKKELYFEGVTECCAIDYETFRFIKTSNLKIPFKIEEVNTKYDFIESEMEYLSSFKISMPLVDSSNHLNNAKAVLPIALALSKEETENIYSSKFELAIKYSKQAMLNSEAKIYMNKKADRIDFAYKDNNDVVLELGYIKLL